jgi:cell division ATPase FtsA
LEVEFYGIDGRELRRVKNKTIVEIIQPRVEEVFSLIAKELETLGWLEVIVPGGVILTGGGAQLKGLSEASMELLGVPSRLGLPQFENMEVIGTTDYISKLTFAAGISLLHYSQNPPLWGMSVNGRSHLGFDLTLGRKSRNGIGRKFQNFFEELFSYP